MPNTQARRLRDAAEPLAGVVFWSKPAYDAMAELGLEFLTGYVWGRTAPMGEPAAPVAVAAFGVFEPSLVTGLYEQARALCSREAVLAGLSPLPWPPDPLGQLWQATSLLHKYRGDVH